MLGLWAPWLSRAVGRLDAPGVQGSSAREKSPSGSAGTAARGQHRRIGLRLRCASGRSVRWRQVAFSARLGRWVLCLLLTEFGAQPSAGANGVEPSRECLACARRGSAGPFDNNGTPVKNANVFIDVDLTLVDGSGRLLEGARAALTRLQAAGCHLFLWSSVGADYARAVATTYDLLGFFEGFAAKPDIIIDDMPATTRAPFSYAVGQPYEWQELAEQILAKHVDQP